MSEPGPFQHLSRVMEMSALADAIGDDDLTDAMNTIVKLADKEVSPQVAVKLLPKLSAQAAIFRANAKYYMLLNKDGDAALRKNIYLNVADSLKDLVDSLKYVAKLYTP